MSQRFLEEHDVHLRALLAPLSQAGVPYWYDPTQEPLPTSCYDVWVPLRPAMQVLRLSQGNQRFVERQLARQDDSREDLRWHHGDRYRVALVSMAFFTTQVVRFGEHPACHAWNDWHTRVVVALMRHGWYDPATGHEPPPDALLDAIERREAMQAKFDACFPWFQRLPRYRLVRDVQGKVMAVEPINATEEEDDAE